MTKEDRENLLKVRLKVIRQIAELNRDIRLLTNNFTEERDILLAKKDDAISHLERIDKQL